MAQYVEYGDQAAEVREEPAPAQPDAAEFAYRYGFAYGLLTQIESLLKQDRPAEALAVACRRRELDGTDGT